MLVQLFVEGVNCIYSHCVTQFIFLNALVIVTWKTDTFVFWLLQYVGTVV